MKLNCPYCHVEFTKAALREHRCVANHNYQITKQDLWILEEQARIAAGLPERTYGYEVEFGRHDGTTGKFRIASSSEKAARRKAALQRCFRTVISVTAFTYERYCRAFGVPGMRM